MGRKSQALVSSFEFPALLPKKAARARVWAEYWARISPNRSAVPSPFVGRAGEGQATCTEPADPPCLPRLARPLSVDVYVTPP